MIAVKLKQIRHQIEAAALSAGRAPSDIKLIAVSKTQPLEAVEQAISAGQIIFGENRVQEAKTKFPQLKDKYPGLELHLIGPLQTNKAEEAAKLFDVIQTLDRSNLATALAKAVKKTGKTPRIYIEVNIGRENQKAGILPEALPAFLNECQYTHGLKIEGLMCIPPILENPEPHFRRLKQLADCHKIHRISMGMSADYETAIRCGATEVRIGTAVFGERTL